MCDISYPFFCKYNNGNSLFRVDGPDRFTELQKIGSQVIKHEIVAEQYPEKLRIMDMVSLKDGIWVISSEEEFEETLLKIQK